jgi:signal transduction histidine kinase
MKDPGFAAARRLEEVLITDELARRPARTPDDRAENQVLAELSRELAQYPEGVLPKICECARQLCHADSAGIAILEPGADGGVLRWHALAGDYAVHLGADLPRKASPGGVVLSRNTVALFTEPDRFFSCLRDLEPHLHEILVAPWDRDGRPVGTLWTMTHRPGPRFDAEDARVLTNLASLAAAAFGVVARAHAVDHLRAERAAALNLMEDALNAHKEAESATSALHASEERLWLALQETQRAREEAENAGRAKDQFLAVLSHELRTPLTPVMLALRRLSRRTDLPEGATDALAMIQRNVELEARFIDDLLDLTRISRGSFEIMHKPLDLHEVIRQALEVVGPEIEAKGHRITLELTATHSHLVGDAARLQQVFWNLLRNAAKFTPDGGSILVRSRDEKASILAEVRDSGIGFEPGSAERIFSAFVQANAAISREFGGLGLGLAISRAVVTAHSGTIAASSPGPNQGASFTVSLPWIETADK